MAMCSVPRSVSEASRGPPAGRRTARAERPAVASKALQAQQSGWPHDTALTGGQLQRRPGLGHALRQLAERDRTAVAAGEAELLAAAVTGWVLCVTARLMPGASPISAGSRRRVSRPAAPPSQHETTMSAVPSPACSRKGARAVGLSSRSCTRMRSWPMRSLSSAASTSRSLRPPRRRATAARPASGQALVQAGPHELAPAHPRPRRRRPHVARRQVFHRQVVHRLVVRGRLRSRDGYGPTVEAQLGTPTHVPGCLLRRSTTGAWPRSPASSRGMSSSPDRRCAVSTSTRRLVRYSPMALNGAPWGATSSGSPAVRHASTREAARRRGRRRHRSESHRSSGRHGVDEPGAVLETGERGADRADQLAATQVGGGVGQLGAVRPPDGPVQPLLGRRVAAQPQGVDGQQLAQRRPAPPGVATDGASVIGPVRRPGAPRHGGSLVRRSGPAPTEL